MITTINEFKKYLITEEESTDTIVTGDDVEDANNNKITLDTYNSDKNIYNNKKNTFKNIFTKYLTYEGTDLENKMTTDARKIYQYTNPITKAVNYTNAYLLDQWKISKIENNINKQLDKQKKLLEISTIGSVNTSTEKEAIEKEKESKQNTLDEIEETKKTIAELKKDMLLATQQLQKKIKDDLNNINQISKISK